MTTLSNFSKYLTKNEWQPCKNLIFFAINMKMTVCMNICQVNYIIKVYIITMHVVSWGFITINIIISHMIL